MHIMLLAGAWENFLVESEEVFAFARELGSTRAIALANWTEKEIGYVVALVEGLELLAGASSSQNPACCVHSKQRPGAPRVKGGAC